MKIDLSEKEILKSISLEGGYELIREGRAIFIKAVDDVDIVVKENEIVGIAGESGCGKSTLIKILYGFIQRPLVVKNGKVIVKSSNNRIIDILNQDIQYIRRYVWWKTISYIPQNSMSVLDPTRRVKDQFIDIFKAHNEAINKKEAIEYITDYLKTLGLPTDVLNSYPHQLSGGMKQRVVIALSLILNPKIILADEPTTAVDVVTQLAILSFLKKWQRDKGSSLVIVSHDMGVHAYMDDRIYIMYAGSIVEGATKESIFDEPLHPYTQGLIKSLIKKGEKTLKIGLPGEPPNLLNPPPGCRFHPRCPYAMDICRRDRPSISYINSERIVRCWLYARK